MNDKEPSADLLAQLLAESADRQASIDKLHTALLDNGWMPRVRLHQYLCMRGCVLAEVFRAGGLTLCAVRDYKLSPGMNRADTAPSAREKRTLDGNRHWPGHVYDVAEIAEWGAGIPFNCRHYRGVVAGTDVLTTVATVTPGHPKAPTRLTMPSRTG